MFALCNRDTNDRAMPLWCQLQDVPMMSIISVLDTKHKANSIQVNKCWHHIRHGNTKIQQQKINRTWKVYSAKVTGYIFWLSSLTSCHTINMLNRLQSVTLNFKPCQTWYSFRHMAAPAFITAHYYIQFSKQNIMELIIFEEIWCNLFHIFNEYLIHCFARKTMINKTIDFILYPCYFLFKHSKCDHALVCVSTNSFCHLMTTGSFISMRKTPQHSPHIIMYHHFIFLASGCAKKHDGPVRLDLRVQTC